MKVHKTIPSLIFAFLALAATAQAQSNVGVVRGTVSDQSGAVITGATVKLTNSITKYDQTVVTDSQGNYQFIDIPFNHYTITVQANSFNQSVKDISVESNLTQQIDLQLNISSTTQIINITTAQELLNPDKTAPSTIIDKNQIVNFASSQPSRSTEEIISSVPGWTLDANGRLHARGLEYQVQYSLDGIPVTDTIAATFASSPDPDNFRSMEITTSNIPAEYGNKVAGIIAVNTKSGLEIPTSGSFTIAGGSFSSFESGFDIGGHTKKFGFYASAAGSTTRRFLDPPVMENLHNSGESIKSFFKLDYNPNPNDLLRFNFSFGGARFQVPNFIDQQSEGQDQRRRLNDNMESFSWQHVFSPKLVSYFALFHRYNFANLKSNDATGPVYALQSRHYTTYGFLGSLTYQFKKNLVKAGLEFTRFPVTESFTFAITDLNEVLEMQPDLPDAVRDFTIQNPFFFRDHRSGWEGSAYLQDHISNIKNFSFDLGVRFDSYHFLVTKNFVSPRVGMSYYIPKTGTVLRASFNRFLETPALENLLLSSSDKTRIFSPAGEDMMMDKHTKKNSKDDLPMEDSKGEPVKPSREWQVDVGFEQRISKYARINADFYYRRLKNPPEIVNFLETGIIFPATLSKSRSKGVETRLDIIPTHGFSAFVSYTNLHIYGFAPITGGLFLGEAVDLFSRSGQRVNIEEDQRNTVVFQTRYDRLPGKAWISFGGRHDSGFSVELEPDASIEEFQKEFPQRVLNQVNFDRGFIKPHTVLNLSIGKDMPINEHLTLSGQFNIQNLADKFYLITFESVFSGTTIGRPRNYSGKLTLSFK